MINIAKLGLYGMFLNYYPFHIMFGHMIPFGTYIFFAMIVIGVLGDASSKHIGIVCEKENRNWIIYLVVSLLTSILAISTSFALSSLWKYAIRVVLIIAVTYICREERSIMFAIRLLAVTSILSATTAFMQMSGLHGRLKLDSGADISVNDFGSIMSYGCFAVILFFRYNRLKSNFWKMALTLGSTLLLIIEMFIAGSRKSFIAVVILYALLLIFVWSKNLRIGKVISFLILGAIVVLIANKYLLPNLEETSLYQRMWGYKAEESLLSDDGRMKLYNLALSDFISHPIFGLGFDNFTYEHGNYTHSTYVDPIACSGLFALFYLIPYVTLFIKQWKRASFERKQSKEFLTENEILVFYIMFLFIGVGIPYLYKDIPCIILGMMVAHQYIDKDVVLERAGEANEW